MRAEAGRVAGAAHVADEELLVRVAQMQLGLEAAVVNIALREAVADEDDALAVRRRRDRLRTGYGGGGGLVAFGAWRCGISVLFVRAVRGGGLSAVCPGSPVAGLLPST